MSGRFAAATRFITDASPTEPYHSSSSLLSDLCRQKNRHMGQVKLLLSEIDFLTDFAINRGTVIVYVGAADGMHIPTLDRMFMDLRLQWRLYDPSPFSQNVLDWQKRNPDRVKVHTRVFTDEDTAAYASLDQEEVLFICDIRTLGAGRAQPGDEEVMLNQVLTVHLLLAYQILHY